MALGDCQFLIFEIIDINQLDPDTKKLTRKRKKEHKIIKKESSMWSLTKLV